MKKVILTLVTVLLFSSAYSQTVDSTISIHKKKYYQNEQRLSNSNLKTILVNNPAASAEYKLFKKNSNIATPFLIVSGASILASGITSLSSAKKRTDDLNNGIINGSYSSGLGFAIIGLTCIIVSIPFVVSANKHLNQAVSLYNSDIAGMSRKTAVEFNLVINPTGLGVQMRF